MNRLITDLGLKIEDSQIITIAGLSNVGKTSVMTIMACEAVKDGKKVLYITDDSFRVIAKKVFKLVSVEDVDKYEMMVKSTKNYGTICDYLDFIFRENSYDLVVLDIPQINWDYLFLKEFTSKHNCTFIMGQQLLCDLSMPKNILVTKSQKANQISDVVISVTKKPVNKKSFWLRLKEFICFWKEPSANPNITLGIMKSRYGSNGNHDIELNFENLTFKSLSNKK